MKIHKPLQNPTNFIEFGNILSQVKKMENVETFTNDEKLLILAVKDKVKHQFNEFNLTVQKLGRNLPHSYFVTGGCFASLLRAEIPNDYDVYFFSQLAADPIVKLYTEDPAYQNEVEVLDEKYRDAVGVKDSNGNTLLVTENAVTLKNGLQLITKHYGNPTEIRQTFDFVHCMPYYNSLQDKLYISREQYDLIMNKKLKVNNPNTVTKRRTDKFMARGWTWL